MIASQVTLPAQCDALVTAQDGIWGGSTAEERLVMRGQARRRAGSAS
jgi:hypothetical protein